LYRDRCIAQTRCVNVVLAMTMIFFLHAMACKTLKSWILMVTRSQDHMSTYYYFHACVKCQTPILDYHNNIDGYTTQFANSIFMLDHYPSEIEIIHNVLPHGGIDPEVLCYSVLCKDAFNAYNSK